MRVLAFTNTATDLAAQKTPFLAGYKVLIFNYTGGSLTLQDSADNSSFGTLQVCADKTITEVTLNKQYVKVSTAGTLYAVGN